jgi:hypothetical protein
VGSWRRATALTAGLLAGAVLYGQRGFRGFDEDYDTPQLPADHDERTEFYFARLKYDSQRGGWRYSSWATDYPKADRQFLQGVRRLTRIHSRSVEEVIDINTDAIYNYPWVYAVEVGHWSFTDKQAARMRDYLNRGGFLMVDDFHGTLEWQVFAEGIQKVLPNRPIVNLEDGEAVFHLLYEIDKKVQVPGIHVIRSGRTYERDGYEPRWRGIYDDKGRLVVAICHNMDLGDAWEWADHPAYPENMASVAYRIALNYILYSMTH